jgi:hypothetical protein
MLLGYEVSKYMPRPISEAIGDDVGNPEKAIVGPVSQ